MITYNNIYDASRNERYSEELQNLPANFVEEVAEYLKEKKGFSEKEEEFSDSAVKTKKQIENALTLFRELMIQRKKKILNLVLIAAQTGISKKDFDNMLDFEKELFKDMIGCVDSSDKKLNGILNLKNRDGNPKRIRETENRKQKVVFLENVDEFLGLEGEKIGPFKKKDEVSLPKEIAQILIDAGKVESL